MQNEDDSSKRKRKNKIIGWIESNSSEYQRLLKHVADYFTQSKVWWQETHAGVELFDVENVKTKQIHHFWSQDIRKEMQYVADCWSKCFLDKNILIPAYKLKVKDGAVITTVYMTTLAYFRTMALEMIDSVLKLLECN